MSDTLQTGDCVKKTIMYVAVVISLVVGFLGGIIYSSIQGDSVQPIAQMQSPAQPMASNNMPGLTPQQGSKIMALNKQLTANPQDVTAWTELGNVYFDTGQFKQAINAYKKSLALRPGNASVLTDLGVMYRRSGQPDKAIKTFDRASAIDPANTQAKFNKGVVFLYDKGDAAGAIRIWEDLLKSNPGAMAGNGRSVADFITEAQKKLK